MNPVLAVAVVTAVALLSTVTPIPAAFVTTLRFVAPGGDFDGVLFHALKPGPVLAAFRAYGWPVTGS